MRPLPAWRACAALLALLFPAAGCGPRAGGASEEDYGRVVDPGLREEYYWAVVGRGTCTAGQSVLVRGAQPDPERCDAARFGRVAVCWDGERVRHPEAPGEARCLLLDTTRAGCREVPGGGRLWECVRTDAE